MEKATQILVLTTLLAPLASFAGICTFRRSRTSLISAWALACIAVALIAAATLALRHWNSGALVLELNWFTAGDRLFEADLSIARKSLLMLVVVTFISLLVHLYSTLYMKGDAGWKRYFAMLGFFTFSMQGIVLSDNLLFMFICWELVGFSSYILIGHWTTKPAVGSAASKAFIMNRIGDVGFLIGLMILWMTYDTFSLTAILQVTEANEWHTIAALCVFCGVIGKSAQFPLFTWLPDAMEGPTPVSALIHAATMVAAGVYLLVRLFGIFTPDALTVVAITGMVTALAGALAALSQNDIKKILAYSTMSQLGLMILALGMGAVDAAFLHLVTHAFFKACLFLAAGSVIHALHQASEPSLHFDIQDIRNMGGLKNRLPLTCVAFLLAGASLAGVPFFSGFLSKEAILTALFMHTNMFSWAMIVVILSVSFITALYTFRLVWFVFFGEPRTIRALRIAEPGWQMKGPLIALAMGSLWLIVSINPFDFTGWILQSDPAHHSPGITLFSIAWVGAALVLGWYIFPRAGLKTNALLRNAFYVDRFYATFFDRGLRLSARAAGALDRRGIDKGIHAVVIGQVIFAHVMGWLDRTIVDGTVNTVARLAGITGKFTRSFQGGNVQLYIFWSVFALIIFIIWLL